MGAINIKHTGSGAAIALSSDGTSLLLDGTAIGGGGGGDPALYRDNASSATTPIAGGTNAVAIGTGSSASGTYGLAIGRGTTASGYDSLALVNTSTASGSDSMAFGSNAVAGPGNFTLALGGDTDATGFASAAIGKDAQSVGSRSTAIGQSYASGADSFAAAIANNTSSYGATGANSIAIGYQAKATSSYSISIGWGNSAGNRSLAIGGQGSTAGDNSVCVGTWQSNISNAYSAAVGGGKASDRGVQNRWAYGLVSAPAVGAAQGGLHVEYAQTTDATPTVLKTNSSAVNTQNQVILPNNSAYAFHGTIVARQQASQGTACAAWKIEGLIRREGSAGTTVLVNSATTILDNTPAWGMTLSADTTNGGLAITVTGAAATNIRWVATINTSEVTY